MPWGSHSAWLLSQSTFLSGALGSSGDVCMSGWANRAGNNLQQLEVALVHAERTRAAGVKLPHGDTSLFREGILRLTDYINVLFGSRSSSTCLPCSCCGDFTDLQYKCGVVSPADRWRVARQYLQPLVSRCEVPLSSELCTRSPYVVLHMRGGDVMGHGIESGWYAQPPCSFYQEVVERGFMGSRFHCVIIVSEDQTNPCIASIQAQYAAQFQSSTVRADACLLMTSPFVAISFGSWGASLLRLSQRLVKVFVPFGEDNGARYFGMLDSSLAPTISALHYSGWAAFWANRSVLVEDAPFRQALYSFPDYQTSWNSWDDRVKTMISYDRNKIVVRTIPLQWVPLPGCAIPSGDDVMDSPEWLSVGVAEGKCSANLSCLGFTHMGPPELDVVWVYFKSKAECVHSEGWTSYRRVGDANFAIVEASSAAHTVPWSDNMSVAALDQDVASLLDRSAKGGAPRISVHIMNEGPTDKRIISSAPSKGIGQASKPQWGAKAHDPCIAHGSTILVQVCAVLRDWGVFHLVFSVGGSPLLRLRGVEVSGHLLVIASTKILARQPDRLECFAYEQRELQFNGRLIQQQVGNVIRLVVHFDEKSFVHVGVFGGFEQGSMIGTVLLSFDFLASPKTTFRSIPNLHLHNRSLVSDHFFRSPAAMLASEDGSAVALLPDLDVLGSAGSAEHARRLPLPQALDLRQSPLRIIYGLAASRLQQHMYAEAIDDQVISPWSPTDTFVELFASQLILRRPCEPADLVNATANYFWERYGRRNLHTDIRPQVMPFEMYGRKYVLNGHLNQLLITLPGPSYGIDNPARNGINYDAWENDAQVAFGLQYYAEQWRDQRLLGLAEGMWRFGLSSPIDRGAFPAVFNPRSGAWELMFATLGHHSKNLTCDVDSYYSLPAMAVTMWHYIYLIQTIGSRHENAILKRLENFTSLLVNIQLEGGAIPHWISRDSFEPCWQLRESASTAISAAVLAKAAVLLPLQRRVLSAAAVRAGEYIVREVLPRQKFFDFELFFSCSPKTLGWEDPIAGIVPQNTLSMQWAADMFLSLERLTNEDKWLQYGQYVLSILSLYQQVWSPPYFMAEAYMFGGFGVMNTDAEWSDGRSHRFVFTYLDYYLRTGHWEYLERAVAAGRAGFTNMDIEENHRADVSHANGPWEPENLEHFGEHDKGQWTGFTWGSGGALAATAYLELMVGSVWIDIESKRVLGVDSVTVQVLQISASEVRLVIVSARPSREGALATRGWRRVWIRSKWSQPVRLEVNGRDFGMVELAKGTRVSWRSDGTVEAPPKLLSDAEMQLFIVHGFIVVQPSVNDSLHDRIVSSVTSLRRDAEKGRDEGNNVLPLVPELMDIFLSPEVDGALRSILGEDYAMHAHRHAHENIHFDKAQESHQDSYYGSQKFRPHKLLWAMALYYPQDTTLEMGPTAVIPGSQYSSFEHRFRYNGESDFDNRTMEQSIGTMTPLCVPRGAVVVINYDIFHAAQQRLSREAPPRWMFKFQFYRVTDPGVPSWDHTSSIWRPQLVSELPACHGSHGIASYTDLQISSREPVWRWVWSWLLGDHFELAQSNGKEPQLIDVLQDMGKSQDERVGAAYRLAAVGELVGLLRAFFLAEANPVRQAAIHGLIAASHGKVEGRVPFSFVASLMTEILSGKWLHLDWVRKATDGLCCIRAPVYEMEYAAVLVLSHARLGVHEVSSGVSAVKALAEVLRQDGVRNDHAGGAQVEQEFNTCMARINAFRLCEGGLPATRAAAAEGVGYLAAIDPQNAVEAMLSVMVEFGHRSAPKTLKDFDDARAVMEVARGLAMAARRSSLMQGVLRQGVVFRIFAETLQVLSMRDITDQMKGQPKDFRRYAIAEMLHALSWFGDTNIFGIVLDWIQQLQPDRPLLVKLVADDVDFRRALYDRICAHTATGSSY